VHVLCVYVCLEVQASDDDQSESSWAELALKLEMAVAFVHRSVQKQEQLLIHCDSGLCTSVVRRCWDLLVGHNLCVGRQAPA
jgi:hypothetical protein